MLCTVVTLSFPQYPAGYLPCVQDTRNPGDRLEQCAQRDSIQTLASSVAILFLGKRRPTSLAPTACCLGVGKLPPIVNEAFPVGQVDGSTGLASGLVVSSQLRSNKLEVTTTPVL